MKKSVEKLTRLGLTHNPFEPAASGPALVPGEIWVPDRWKQGLQELLGQAAQANTPKAIALVGEYGSGKTVLLRWLERVYFAKKRIQAYYFENPGVRFYDLANSWFRQIGRFELAKALIELLGTDVKGFQTGLFETDFLTWLDTLQRDKRKSRLVASGLQDAIRGKGITNDEEIARRMAMLIMETPSKPYFEYKDFVAGRAGSLVAEGQEARYFRAFIRATRMTAGVECIAFLVDEFEEIALRKRLTTREAHDYFATLKRLIDISIEEDFWLIVTMTPPAYDKTLELAPASIERFTGRRFDIPALNEDECRQLIADRLERSRPAGFKAQNSCYPFPDDFSKAIRKDTRSKPRRLVQWAFWCLSRWEGEGHLPFDSEFMKDVERGLVSSATGSEEKPIE